MQFVLEHGVENELENPAVADVSRAMASARTEDYADDLQLKFGTPGAGQPQLWIVCIFIGEPPGKTMWCVRHVLDGAKTSKYLALNGEVGEKFMKGYMCGCEESVDAACILDEEQALAAAQFFLDRGKLLGDGQWIESSECFR